jgi:uncharacterized membrane protein
MSSPHRPGRARIAIGAAAGRLALALLTLTTALFGFLARADFYEIEPVVLPGDLAPGGGRFAIPGSARFGAAGELILTGVLDNGLSGIFRRGDTSEALIALEGQPVPGLNGATFTGFLGLDSNVRGQVAFIGQFSIETPEGRSSGEGIFVDSGEGPESYVLKEDAAPGIPGFSIYGFDNVVALNDRGALAFIALLIPTNSPGSCCSRAVFVDPGTRALPVAIGGAPAPDGEAYVLDGRGSPFLGIDGRDAAAFTVRRNSNALNSLFLASPTEARSVVVPGQLAPGSSGATYELVRGCAVGEAGDIAFFGALSEPSSGNSFFVDLDGHQAPRVLGGSPAPGSDGGRFAVVSDPSGPVTLRCALNQRSDLAFVAEIDGGSASRGLYVLRGDVTLPVALQGESAPDTDGAFASFGIPSSGINVHGDVLFESVLNGEMADRGLFLATRVMEIDVDVAPESDVNNLPASAQSLVAVALLGSERLDVSDVAARTLTFGPGRAEPVHTRGGHLRDANGDGYADLVSHFRVGDSSIGIGTSEACLHGATLLDRPFHGCDEVIRTSKAFYEVLSRWADPHVSADGSVVVGSVAFPDFVGTIYRWTLSPSGVTTEILPLDHAQLHGTNGDGSVIVGSTVGGAFRWTEGGGTQILGEPLSRALDVSSDGAVVVGHSDGEAFRWTEASGLHSLGALRGDSSSQATAVEGGDGGVVVGFSVGPPRPQGPPSLRAFRWTPAVGMRSLGALPGRTGPGRALGISSSGNVVVGQFDFEAFRWTGPHGVGLGFLPGHTTSMAFDVSSDGNRIVGYSLIDVLDPDAFLWTPDGRMRSLEVVLGVDEGLDLAGVDLLAASSISDDGQVIAGWGRRGASHVTWIADLREIPAPDAYQCYGLETSRDSPKFEEREVSLSDQFRETVQVVRKGRRLCAPVHVDGAEVSDPEAHLLCYALNDRHDRSPRQERDSIDVRVSNEFGDDQRLTVKRPRRLCVPSTKEHAESGAAPGDPWELELDHFLCYGVRARSRDFDPIEVSLADQFQTSERLLKKPRSLCTPVAKNSGGILDPATHLTCYELKPLDGEPRLGSLKQDVLLSDQFDADQRFTVKRPKTVCVPSLKELVDDGPAACSPIEAGEFGLCRAIIGWGIDPRTGLCAGISGCGCDERCEGRIFPDEMTCQRECGGG